MDISANTDRFDMYCESMKQYKSSVTEAISAVTAVKNNMRSCLWKNSCIGSQINRVLSSMSNTGDRIGKFEMSLENVKNIYQSAESSIEGSTASSLNIVDLMYMGPQKAFNIVGPREMYDESSDKRFDWKEAVYKLIGNFGLAGGWASYFNAAWSLDGVDIGNALLKGIGDGAKVAGCISAEKVIDIFGVYKTVDAIGFRENLALQLDKYNIHSTYNVNNLTNGEINANRVGAFVKWGGVIMTGISKFIGNYDEYNGDFGNYRMYAETAGETAVTVTSSILLTAGISTLMGATAPVWAVAVLGTGAAIGLDYAFTEMFDKNFAECVSDAVIDFGENIVDAAGDVVEYIGDGIRGIGDTVASWFKF